MIPVLLDQVLKQHLLELVEVDVRHAQLQILVSVRLVILQIRELFPMLILVGSIQGHLMVSVLMHVLQDITTIAGCVFHAKYRASLAQVLQHVQHVQLAIITQR